MIQRCQRGIELLKMIGQRPLLINVKRRAEFSGERLDGDAFAKQFITDVTKIVHRFWLNIKV